MRHEVPATANKCSFRSGAERSRWRGALRSEIKEEGAQPPGDIRGARYPVGV